MVKDHVHAEEVSHICTTLFTDLTHLSELETASALTQPGQLSQTTTLSDKSRPPTDPRHRLHAVNTSSRPNACPHLCTAATGCSERAPFAAQALEMGPCDPAKAVKELTLAWEKKKRFSTPWR